MRKLIFGMCGLIVSLSQVAIAATTPIEINGITVEGHPCSLRAIVDENRQLEHLVVSSEQREIYSGNFMTVEKESVVAQETTTFSEDELKQFTFIPEMRGTERKGALLRADFRDTAPKPASASAIALKPEVKRIRIKVLDGDKGFSYSQRSAGSRYSGETFLNCSVRE